MLELDPNFLPAYWLLGVAHIQKRMYEEGIAELQKAVALSGDSPRFLAALGYAYAVSGKKREALGVLEQLNRASERRYVSAYNIAEIYAGLGDEEHSFVWLQKAYERRAALMNSLKTNPHFDSLHPDPRFKDLLRRMNLPPD